MSRKNERSDFEGNKRFVYSTVILESCQLSYRESRWQFSLFKKWKLEVQPLSLK